MCEYVPTVFLKESTCSRALRLLSITIFLGILTAWSSEMAVLTASDKLPMQS